MSDLPSAAVDCLGAAAVRSASDVWRGVSPTRRHSIGRSFRCRRRHALPDVALTGRFDMLCMAALRGNGTADENRTWLRFPRHANPICRSCVRRRLSRAAGVGRTALVACRGLPPALATGRVPPHGPTSVGRFGSLRSLRGREPASRCCRGRSRLRRARGLRRPRCRLAAATARLAMPHRQPRVRATAEQQQCRQGGCRPSMRVFMIVNLLVPESDILVVCRTSSSPTRG